MKSKLSISRLLILPSLILMLSCSKENINSHSGAGSIVSQTLNLNSFTEIEITNYCDVEVVTGTTNKVEFSDYENLIQYLKFEEVGNKLVIKTTPENLNIRNSKAKAKVYMAGNLTGLFITGSGNVNLLNSFNELSQCNISGSGNVKAEINSTSSNLNCTISGSGNIDFLKIASQNGNCTISGSGNISIAVSNTLTAKIAGSGNISYLGNPTVSSTITGSGRLIKL